MSGNTERFSGRVEEYARFRSGYPSAELLGFLREACGLTPKWRVADVGAGTGMLAEVFLGNGNAVAAVEPNAEMRVVCEGLRERWPGLRVVDGTAEATGLEEGVVELVTAGRAFHWFEPEGAAREFRRVLVTGGWVALVAGGPKKGEGEQGRELDRIQRQFETRSGYVASRDARRAAMVAFQGELAGAGGEAPRQAEFVSERRVGWEAFAGFVQSLSCTPMKGEASYPEMRRELQAFFGRWSVNGVLTVPEVCWVSVGRVQPASEGARGR